MLAPLPPDDDELFGAEAAADQLVQRLDRVRPAAVGTTLTPPFGPARRPVSPALCMA